jgi:hypothetical protein
MHTMKTTSPKQTKSRSELFLESSVKNMRAALSDLSMEQFVIQNMQTLFGLEREEYLENVTEDKGNEYYSRSLQVLMKKPSTTILPISIILRKFAA